MSGADGLPTEPARGTPSPPGWFVAAWRLLLVAGTLGYCALATAVIRGLVGGWGLGFRDVVVIGISSLIALLALLPMGAVIDLPEALWEHWVPERRFRAGRCPACGYESAGGECPECGAPFRRPAAYASDWRTARRSAWILVPSWALGLAAGLLAVRADERAFEQQVAAIRRADAEAIDHVRPRAWPASFAELTWNAGRGFSGPPPFESPKIRQ